MLPAAVEDVDTLGVAAEDTKPDSDAELLTDTLVLQLGDGEALLDELGNSDPDALADASDAVTFGVAAADTEAVSEPDAA